MDYSLLYEYQDNLGNTVLNSIVYTIGYIGAISSLLVLFSVGINLICKILNKKVNRLCIKIFYFILSVSLFSTLILYAFSIFYYKDKLVDQFVKEEYIPYYNEQIVKGSNIKSYNIYYEDFTLLKNQKYIMGKVDGDYYHIYKVLFDVESNGKEYISYKKRIIINYPDYIGQKVRDEVNEKIKNYNIEHDIAVLHLRK